MNSKHDPFAGLEEKDWRAQLERDGTSNPAATVKHPCGQCAGSGRWAGGFNRNGNDRCFACNGKGFFKTSARARAENREKARSRKARKIDEGRAAIDDANPGLIETLKGMGSWNSFALSLVNQYMTKGSLSDNQIAAAKKMITKVEATRAAKAKAAEENKVDGIDLTPIREMFETARTSGYKRPIYRAEGLIISRAPDHGKNPGALYVKTFELDEYQGKILETTFQPAREAKPETAEALKTIAADPRAAAVAFGRRTGSCACCGRELTNHNSIELGIGPVCATKWGL